MFVAIVPAKEAAGAIKEMLRRDIVDRGMRIQRDGEEVVIPVTTELLPGDISRRFKIRIEERKDRRRFVRESPIVEIRNDLAEQGLDRAIIERLPDSWEMLGDVLIIKLPEELMISRKIIAEAYAGVLGAKSVLRDLGAIHGEGRQPEMELLLGTDTEATHLENGVLYSLDAANIMFSSGNVDERTRMGSVECDGEVVLDMFAGIGYLSLPMAVHHDPKRIYACEIRKLTYDYLEKNIELNDVGDVMVPVLGDNRAFTPQEKADRILMGYLKDTFKFLPKALQCLKSGGVIHYHENFPNAVLPDRPIAHLREAAGEDWNFEIIRNKVVKTFSPGVSHIAIDARFTSS
jgi:tRNA wybutosine-synthesizing protein 2